MFMLNQLNYSPSSVYKTGKDYEPLHFFLEVLPHSKQFDLLLGYFSSSAIHVLSLGFAHFIANGGKMRMVINNILSEKDKQTLEKAKNNQTNPDYSINDILQLKNSLDSYGEHFFDCIAYLIAQKRIEIVSIRPKNSNGIAHYKSGVFGDETHKVHFKGSCNFTASGFLENLEELDIRKSWIGDDNEIYIEDFTEYFESIFTKKASFAEYLEVEEITGIITNQFGNKDIDELLADELSLVKRKELKIRSNPLIEQKIEELNTILTKKVNEPRFPYPSGARPYQLEAYQSWVENDYKGIFAMATGTGKTITSLNCLLEIYKKQDYYQAVILVPTNVLIEQWTKECQLFKFNTIYKVSSKYNWQNELSTLRTIFTFDKTSQQNFIIISTYKSFFGDSFQKNYYLKLPSSTLFIADEAHNLVSSSSLPYLSNFRFEHRIGLSATPKRIYDEEGTEQLEAFFNDTSPYVTNFDMERAISEGFLCRYKYYPKIVTLTKEEMKAYAEITKKLVRLNFSGDLKNNESAQTLLMQRKRILHKAENKIEVFKNILLELAEDDKLYYTLVYAPEGFSKKGEKEIIEFDEDLEESIKVIDLYSQMLRETSPKTTTDQYTSNSKDKDFILKSFSEGSINVLLSMKCLDEGVDIPRTEIAIFCASTANPRQFIQRRGRILRKHTDKSMATIYDLVVVPFPESGSEYFEMEKRIFKKELERVANFANLADNYYQAENSLQEVLDFYDININTIENNF
jgi:superfamily II DNA or RNA helicase